ncbi:hypothetical protein F5144DRAFT_49626 [Chaetomium tenue]|uniref:Uncharacterized protein n=1 Tax=Chaetomium tenue TaxID=1854479 RepID=A0ACB7PSX6_9PEZI|nr:hypothetical protein F5144DRAFT_49626 [Chaetomium globosum]
MAESPGHNSDFGFANREEDRPDPDVDSGTEEGAEIMRRSQASLFASMVREARDRQRAIEATEIPWTLYDKARDHQDQLTETERQLFLNRGDVVAKALGSPNSLTTEEIHQACGWPPPDVVRANIQHATGGTLSTPVELFAKVKDALENGCFDTAISGEEACLVVHSFYPLEDCSLARSSESHGIPGHRHALALLTGRLGLDIAMFKACGYRWFEAQGYPNSRARQPSPAAALAAEDLNRRMRAARELSDAMASAEDQVRQGTISEEDFLARMWKILADMQAIDRSGFPGYTPQPDDPFQLIPAGVPRPSLSDRVGSGVWPGLGLSVGGFWLFYQGTGFSGPDAVNRSVPLWAELPEDQKDVYRARAEAKHREAWAYYETMLARKDASPNAGFPSAFELFRKEQVADNGEMGFREVLAGWEALTDEQRRMYKQRAWEAIETRSLAAQRITG